MDPHPPRPHRILLLGVDGALHARLAARVPHNTYDLVCSDDVSGALAHVLHAGMDAVLADSRREHGVIAEFLHRVRRLPAGFALPVIVLAPHGDRAVRAALYTLGVDDVLDTPAVLREVVDALAHRLQVQSQLPFASLQRTGRSHLEDGDFIPRLRHWLEMNFADPAASVRCAARDLALSTTALERRIRVTFHTSFVPLLTEYRMSKARMFIDQRRFSIGEIAGKVGILELSRFSTLFTRYNGITPKQYEARRRHAC